MSILALVLVAQAVQAGGLSWKPPPPSWTPDPRGSAMRIATYRVPAAPGDPEGGELAIFFFGKEGGTVAANVERWVRQFTPEAGAPEPSTRTETVNGIRVTRVSAEGTFASGMPGGPSTPKGHYALFGAIAEGPGGNVFFKLTGPRKTVRAASAQFDSMIRSLSRR
jgi:hypothetical protein